MDALRAVGTAIDRLPLASLALLAVVMALLPVTPQPHLVEKLKMLAAGTLKRPIDIFDLLFHGMPLVVLSIKLLRLVTR